MRVTYDPEKRDRTFRERGLDFEDARVVFVGPTLEIEDNTPRGAARHVFSMRKANAREKARIGRLLEI